MSRFQNRPTNTLRDADLPAGDILGEPKVDRAQHGDQRNVERARAEQHAAEEVSGDSLLT